MRSLFVVILFNAVAQIGANEQMTNLALDKHVGKNKVVFDDFVDALVSKLVDRVLQSRPVHRHDLHGTALGKLGHVGISSKQSRPLVYAHRSPLRAPRSMLPAPSPTLTLAPVFALFGGRRSLPIAHSFYKNGLTDTTADGSNETAKMKQSPEISQASAAASAGTDETRAEEIIAGRLKEQAQAEKQEGLSIDSLVETFGEITWPTPKYAIEQTGVVIIVLIVAGIIVLGWDNILNNVFINYVYGY
eukprot:gnl/MRDRNA2_/MRDRNA2_96892_c0_seq1.p1 gnl/MRDRNA2_/MRDRNA2_96892_c0~~gnl/MRDRNA2_/MRDRNA2_96892_c0_seq1.p1  ORF type:complete len:246 (-),score=28.33 gnl/MRDRNA2_/MRDRNA2_96892_c0_seq1:2-739(-)